MFIGREQELKELNTLYNSGKFQMAVIYGRRRIGKSELLNQFCVGKRAVFFTAVENSAGYNLTALTEAIIDAANISNLPRDFAQALDIIAAISKNEKLIFVIDEYPYLAKAEKPFSSVLQKYIDLYFRHSNLMLILCGSAMNFMERQVLGNKSPLYGRRTAQFKIEPFSYYDTAKFVPNYTKRDKLLTYAVFGGTPYYLAQINPDLSLDENILKLFFSKNSLLFEEPGSLLKQELREPQIYNAVITAIASGSTRIAEISSKINKPANLCDKYIKKLMSLGLVVKEKPVGDKTNARSIYILKENMFKFWFCYVGRSVPLISQGLGDKAYKKNVVLNEYMGRVFETICIEYLWRNYDKLPIAPNEIGRWWGNNPIERRQDEIDIMAADDDRAIFGECKYTNAKAGTEVMNDLKRRSEMFNNYKTKYYYIFSKSGFTNDLLEQSKNDGKIKLISVDELL
jgi:AAA+ ATPase superfamily predicted ATPase